MLRGVQKLWHRLSVQGKILACLIMVSAGCMTSVFVISARQMAAAQRKSALYSAQRSVAQAADFIDFRMNALRQSAYSFAYANEDVRTILSRDYTAIPLNKQSQDCAVLSRMLLQIGNTFSRFASDVALYVADDFRYVSMREDHFIKPFSALTQNEWYRRMGSPNQFSYFVPPSLNTAKDCIGVVYLISESGDYSRSVGAIQFNTPEVLIRQTLENCLISPIKCTRDFGQLEFLTAPTVRTSRFQENPVFGHQVFTEPRSSDRGS